MRVLQRRGLLAGAGSILLAGPAQAAEFRYRDWRFDCERVGELKPALVDSVKAQVDIVESLNIKPQIKEFFRGVPCLFDLKTTGGPGAYSFDRDRMILSLEPQPKDNPVFLHELLHAYHDQRLPGGRQNAKLRSLYEAAKAKGDFPPQAYMLTNPGEYFAMCASVVLWGQAARPPRTRANVRQRLPETYAWIVEEFGLQLA